MCWYNENKLFGRVDYMKNLQLCFIMPVMDSSIKYLLGFNNAVLAEKGQKIVLREKKLQAYNNETIQWPKED